MLSGFITDTTVISGKYVKIETSHPGPEGGRGETYFAVPVSETFAVFIGQRDVRALAHHLA
jgi:hypothetical protein